MTQEQKANVKAWIKALRSGKYQQGVGSLNRNEKYCCLGVLADINNIPTNKEEHQTYMFDDGFKSRIRVSDDWFITITGLKPSVQEVLMDLNDTGFKFEYIADYLEGL